ncbi:MAG: alanine dehydrogenase [Chitinophagales bacterium]|nr:alanine dehydrogenase [Chitinophagales bacterium]
MTGESSKPLSGYSVQFGLSPQETMLKIHKSKQQLYIGIPKESSFQENRLPLTPESIQILVNNGHRVMIETKAGIGSHFSDRDFSEAGAEIVYDRHKIFEAEIILKVAPPTEEEIEMLKMNQILITPLHLPTITEGYIHNLMKKKVTALALEYIKDDTGSYPFVRSMSEIAGSNVMILAAELLSTSRNGQGILLGGISGVPPANVVVIGAGVVAEFVTRNALGLGAMVRVFDNKIYKLMRLQNNLGQRIYTSNLYPEVLKKALRSADVVVGAIHSESGRTPIIVTEEMVADMKPGSVIIDVSIDQGGCIETSEITTHQNPTFKKYDVIHYCVPNIASRVSRTASYAMSNILSDTLLKASETGGFEKYLHAEHAARNGVYVYKGCLTNQHMGEKFNIKHTDINLLFTANY